MAPRLEKSDAGDVRANFVKRVAAAVGDGSMSVRFVHQHLATRPLAATA